MEMTTHDRLHLLLGRLVHAFARFDFSMGLQLKWLGPYCGADVSPLLTPSVPFAVRFRTIEPLVIKVFGHQNASARAAFEAWFIRANKAKALRNDYAHGRWSISPAAFLDVPERIEFVRLNWEMDADKQPPAILIDLEEFEQSVIDLESLFHDYWRLEKKYLPGARSSTE